MMMMCDVMPTISEDGSGDRDSQYSGDDANFEQLMVNMLDERDKLMETLRETQETLALTQAKLQDCERDRDAYHNQLSATTPQVSKSCISHYIIYTIYVGIWASSPWENVWSVGKNAERGKKC